jgi:Domain of unknown function (DUF4292)
MNRALAAIFLSLVCAGCPKRVPPAEFGPEGPLTSAREVLARVDAVQTAVEALTSDGKLTVDSPQGRGTLGVFVAVARPACLRIELYDFFNRPQGLLVVNGERFGAYSAQEGKFFTGPASPGNVSRFLPLELPVHELLPVLLGQAPRLPDESPELAIQRDPPAYLLRLRAGEAMQQLLVHPELFRVQRSEVRGVTAYDLAFDDFLERDDLSFPRDIVLASQAAKARLQLRYSDPTLNPPPDPERFTLQPPEGVPVVEVDARGEPVGDGA